MNILLVLIAIMGLPVVSQAVKILIDLIATVIVIAFVATLAIVLLMLAAHGYIP
jgi:hypothetical protein